MATLSPSTRPRPPTRRPLPHHAPSARRDRRWIPPPTRTSTMAAYEPDLARFVYRWTVLVGLSCTHRPLSTNTHTHTTRLEPNNPTSHPQHFPPNAPTLRTPIMGARPRSTQHLRKRMAKPIHRSLPSHPPPQRTTARLTRPAHTMPPRPTPTILLADRTLPQSRYQDRRRSHPQHLQTRLPR